MLIASFCFALTGACARYLRNDINPIELVLFRNIIGVVFILYSIRKTPVIQTGGKLYLLIFRGVIGTMALYTFFYGISKIGLAIAITYQQSYPVFLSVMAMWFFRERLRKIEWLAVVLGFMGICLIFLPSIDASQFSIKYHFIGISNAIMTGMAYLSIRGLSVIYDQRSIILSFMLSGIILPLVSLSIGSFWTMEGLDFMFDQFDAVSITQAPAILLLGVAALLGQIYLTKAFSYEKTGIIAAIGYSNIIFSIAFGTLLGDVFPDVLSLMGIGLIVACGVMVSWRKKVKTV